MIVSMNWMNRASRLPFLALVQTGHFFSQNSESNMRAFSGAG
jgi:hypothetical protein